MFRHGACRHWKVICSVPFWWDDTLLVKLYKGSCGNFMWSSICIYLIAIAQQPKFQRLYFSGHGKGVAFWKVVQ